MNNSKIPSLRFSEFTSDWHVTKLGDLLKIGSGRDYKHLSNGNIPVYGTGGLMLYVNDYLYDGKSICIGRKGTINKPQFLNGKFWTVDTLFYTHDYKNSIPEFLYLIFQKINWLQHNEASGVPSLSKTTIEKIKVTIPDIQEQKKIADFLTAIDDKITIIDKKIKLLKQYKKGAMQKVFSQQIRFKDETGKDYPAWQHITLDDVLTFARNGLSIEQNTRNLGRKVTRIETISTGSVNPMKTGYIDTDLDISEYKLKVGDLLFSNINSPSQIGRTVYVDREYDIYHGMNLLCLRVDNENSPLYVYYLLTSHKYKQYFEAICNKAVNQASINQTDLKKTKIVMPSKEEQCKVADFLASLDDKIKLTEEQLVQAKTFKKSLLQRMLFV